MEQLTKEQAIAFYNSKAWEPMSAEQRAKFQIEQDRLCMPISVFHEAIEATLGRGVYTHEFALDISGLKQELFLGKKPPTLAQIMELIPEDKRVVIAIK